MLIEKSFRLHDHAVDAVAALRCLLIDEGLLQPMRMRRAPEAFERGHVRVADAAHRIYARACGLAVDEDGTGTALRETAPKARSAQS